MLNPQVTSRRDQAKGTAFVQVCLCAYMLHGIATIMTCLIQFEVLRTWWAIHSSSFFASYISEAPDTMEMHYQESAAIDKPS